MSSNLNNVEPMQLDASIDDGEIYELNEPSTPINPDQLVHKVESAPFEVESYISQYSGYLKLMRLLFIADHCPSLQIDALEQALKFVKESTFNVNAYGNIHKKLIDALALNGQSSKINLYSLDTVWMEEKSKMSQIYFEKLDNDLKNYKTNSIKESIRRGHDDLGIHYLQCGDLGNALKCFSRSRDYCMGEQQMLNICLNVIKISIYQRNWLHVNSFICKAENSPEMQTNSAAKTKINCLAGLYDLVTKRYKNAVKRFMAANIDEISTDFSDVLSANNVAIYGGLCALATLNRSALHKQVISNTNYKLFLELEPQLRESIHKFYESKYTVCLSLLDEMKDSFLLDMFLAPRIDELYSMIRNRALVQYFSPYLSADLVLMARSFNTTITLLEDELMQLILDGQIQARIDSHNKILYAKDSDERLTTFENSLEMGRKWQMKTAAFILRAACSRNGHIVVSPQIATKGDEVPSSQSTLTNICAPSSPGKSRN
ncbi:hypothetical protein RDWZM_003104 [Blomia tropicalis]|uniref:PCI domain-containing protein n=1 Tax=Blomia tropicalis TaxID=40697 RepID=A0A9Q0RS75_BLOTA|nr:cop9 signalosome complex subunit [Blomia tropicalis]KAJ6224559.1 hypothetical protein RDWZM_003104 [Blomia tropicalis]